MASKKKDDSGHAPNADGVCSNCGLEMAYLLAAGTKCHAAPK